MRCTGSSGTLAIMEFLGVCKPATATESGEIVVLPPIATSYRLRALPGPAFVAEAATSWRWARSGSGLRISGHCGSRAGLTDDSVRQ